MQITGQPVPIDWDAVEAWLGTRLPTDYKELAGYGPLDIGEFIWVHVPCAQEGVFDYGDWLTAQRRTAAHNGRPDGLLAWGTTRNSVVFFWDTAVSEDPDRWPVVVFDMHEESGAPWFDCEMSLTATLSQAIHSGLPLPRGDLLGPLPPIARRTAFLTEAVAWTPPPHRRLRIHADVRPSPPAQAWQPWHSSCHRPASRTWAAGRGTNCSLSWGRGCRRTTSR